MKIDFNEIEINPIPHFRGGEKETITQMYTDDSVKIMYGRLEPGASIGLHTHETNSEGIFILSGTGKTIYDDTEEALSPGDCHYCPQGHSHSLINNGNEDLVFFAMVPEL